MTEPVIKKEVISDNDNNDPNTLNVKQNTKEQNPLITKEQQQQQQQKVSIDKKDPSIDTLLPSSQLTSRESGTMQSSKKLIAPFSIDQKPLFMNNTPVIKHTEDDLFN